MTDLHRLTDLRDRMQAHLDRELIPFWVERVIDRRGGYWTHFDGRGKRLPLPDKRLVPQARHLWVFSRLTRRSPGSETFRSLAARGLDFLLSRFWDAEHGGFVWSVRPDGRPLDQEKLTYAQSFAMYALAEYSLATGDTVALDYARRAFDLLQRHTLDTVHGGYFAHFTRDWTRDVRPTAPDFRGDRKTLDTHLHLLESLTALLRATGDNAYRDALRQLVRIIETHVIDAETGCPIGQFDPQWRPQSVRVRPHVAPPLYRQKTLPFRARRFALRRLGLWNAPGEPAEHAIQTVFGHNLELAWLLHDAFRALAEPVDPRKPILWAILDHTLRHGLDAEHGGLFLSGRPSGEILCHEKRWWDHAESLVGFLDGYELFGDARYLDAVASLWAFVARCFIIPGVGEWRTLLARDGAPIVSETGYEWKAAYHTGRAMIECVERLTRLIDAHAPLPA